jgi:hypothetical protein
VGDEPLIGVIEDQPLHVAVANAVKRWQCVGICDEGVIAWGAAIRIQAHNPANMAGRSLRFFSVIKPIA